jgi:hypothetical protein
MIIKLASMLMNMAARATLYEGSDDFTKGHIVASRRILVTMVLGKNQHQYSQSTLKGLVKAIKIGRCKVDKRGFLTDTRFQT